MDNNDILTDGDEDNKLDNPQNPQTSSQLSRLERLERMMEKSLGHMQSLKRKRVEDSDEYEESSEDDDIDEQPEEESWLTEDEEEDEGPELATTIVSYVKSKVLKRVPKEQLKKKMLRQKIPKNMRCAKEVKVNGAIYDKLSRFAKKRDAGFRNIQGQIGKAIVAMSKVAEKVLKMSKKEEPEKAVDAWGNEMYDNVFDAITIASQASFQLNMKRVSENYNVSKLILINLEKLYLLTDICRYLLSTFKYDVEVK